MKQVFGVISVAAVAVFNMYVAVPVGYGFDLDTGVIALATFVGSVGGTIAMVFVGDRVMPAVRRLYGRVGRKGDEQDEADQSREENRADRMRSSLAVGIGVLLVGTFAATADSSDSRKWTPSRDRAPVTGFWAVGDIGKGDAAKPVSELIASKRFARLLYLGDVYETGTAQEFQDNYDRHFGRFALWTVPTIGNHEFDNRATGFDPYWTSKRGSAPPRNFVFTASGWQIIVLNSELDMNPGSQQYRWLEGLLERTEARGNCRIAFEHHPRYSIAPRSDNADVEPLYRLLARNARAFISGHDHGMQRFEPKRGIRQFISAAAGTGGYDYTTTSEADIAWANFETKGALRFTLKRLRKPGGRNNFSRMTWRFLSTEQATLDRGSLRCERNTRRLTRP